jgi:hypothetical protein
VFLDPTGRLAEFSAAPPPGPLTYGDGDVVTAPAASEVVEVGEVVEVASQPAVVADPARRVEVVAQPSAEPPPVVEEAPSAEPEFALDRVEHPVDPREEDVGPGDALPALAALLESMAEAAGAPLPSVTVSPRSDVVVPPSAPAATPAPRQPERDVPWPGPAVSLVFVDGSEFRLPAGDATAQELIALAGELSLGVQRRTG